MPEHSTTVRDVETLKVARVGRVEKSDDPLRPFRQPSRRGTYQPKEPKPPPRTIPDQASNDLFCGLKYNRDRALIAFYVSTGARASELLGVPQGMVAPGARRSAWSARAARSCSTEAPPVTWTL